MTPYAPRLLSDDRTSLDNADMTGRSGLVCRYAETGIVSCDYTTDQKVEREARTVSILIPDTRIRKEALLLTRLAKSDRRKLNC